jgi:hypothetical protein
VSQFREIKPAGQIVHELVEEARRIIAQRLLALVQPASAGGPGPDRTGASSPITSSGSSAPRRANSGCPQESPKWVKWRQETPP